MSWERVSAVGLPCQSKVGAADLIDKKAGGEAQSRAAASAAPKAGEAQPLTASGAGGYPGEQESAVEGSTYMADGRKAGPRRRVRGAHQSRCCAVGGSLARGCRACASGRARSLRAPSAAVRALGAVDAGWDRGAGAHRGVHGQAAGVADRAAACGGRTSRGQRERHGGERPAGGVALGGTAAGAPARWRRCALRSSSSPTAWRQRAWRRPMRCSCPSADA